MGLDPAREPRAGQAPGRLPARRGRLLRRPDRAPEPALHGAPQRAPRRRGRGGRSTTSLEQVGLTDRADDRVETYSRGMRQRLGIADALVKSPDLLILDEPTTAIDPLGVVEILELLRRLVHERGLAILLSSHLLTQVQSVCDRIGIFAAGRLVGQGTVDELATHVRRRDGDHRGRPRAADAGRRRAGRGRCSARSSGVDRGRPAGDGRRALAGCVVRPAAAEGRGPPGDPRRRRRARPAPDRAPARSCPSLDDIYRTAVVRTAA